MCGTLSWFPARLGSGFVREQCKLCPMNHERVPHIGYRDGKKTVSLFVTGALRI